MQKLVTIFFASTLLRSISGCDQQAKNCADCATIVHDTVFVPQQDMAPAKSSKKKAKSKKIKSASSYTTKKKRIPKSYRTYYRGPRGGCYYYSASGNKVYVDRSLCN